MEAGSDARIVQGNYDTVDMIWGKGRARGVAPSLTASRCFVISWWSRIYRLWNSCWTGGWKLKSCFKGPTVITSATVPPNISASMVSLSGRFFTLSKPFYSISQCNGSSGCSKLPPLHDYRYCQWVRRPGMNKLTRSHDWLIVKSSET